jgi:hypothetical protein
VGGGRGSGERWTGLAAAECGSCSTARPERRRPETRTPRRTAARRLDSNRIQPNCVSAKTHHLSNAIMQFSSPAASPRPNRSHPNRSHPNRSHPNRSHPNRSRPIGARAQPGAGPSSATAACSSQPRLRRSAPPLPRSPAPPLPRVNRRPPDTAAPEPAALETLRREARHWETRPWQPRPWQPRRWVPRGWTPSLAGHRFERLRLDNPRFRGGTAGGHVVWCLGRRHGDLTPADVAELVDALVSGTSGSNVVGVQVSPSALK